MTESMQGVFAAIIALGMVHAVGVAMAWAILDEAVNTRRNYNVQPRLRAAIIVTCVIFGPLIVVVSLIRAIGLALLWLLRSLSNVRWLIQLAYGFRDLYRVFVPKRERPAKPASLPKAQVRR